MLKVQNKYNYPVLVVVLLYILLAAISIAIVTFDRHFCGTTMVYLFIFTISIILFLLATLIIIAVNKVVNYKYNTDLLILLVLLMLHIVSFVIGVNI